MASHKRDISKQCRPRSDAAERGVWSGSTLFALSTGISVNHGNNKNFPDSPFTRNGPVQRVMVEEATQNKWVNLLDNRNLPHFSYQRQFARNVKFSLETFAWNVKFCFLGKIRNYITDLSSGCRLLNLLKEWLSWVKQTSAFILILRFGRT